MNRWALLLAAALLTGAAGRAAAEPEAPAPALRGAAEKFQQGVEAMRNGDPRTALEAFRAAQTLVSAPATLWNVIVLEVQLGQHLDAHRDLLVYIDRFGASLPSERLKVAEETRRKLERQLARVRVTVIGKPARVQVDGRVVLGWAWLEPGEREVVVTPLQGAGCPSVRRPVVLAPGLEKEIEIDLPECHAPGQRDPGPRGPSVEAQRIKRTAGILAVGAGVTSIAIGAIFGARSLSKKSESDASCGAIRCDANGLALYRDSQSASGVSNVTIGIGAAGAAIGVVLILWSRAEASKVPASASATRMGVGY